MFSSTAAVYDVGDGRLDEDQPTLPVNPYGVTKLAAEQAIGYQAALGRLGAVSLRCFNIAGVVAGHGDRDLTRMIPRPWQPVRSSLEQILSDGWAAARPGPTTG